MKTALITGGSRGVGKATADALRVAGWEVIAPTSKELNLIDLFSVMNWRRLNPPEHLDALIYCAGEWYSKPIEEQTTFDFISQYNLSVLSLATLIISLRSALAGGVVVAVASTRGFIGGVETAPYSCAKAAQIALMSGFAREYPGVRFNTIAPGWTDTDLGELVRVTGGVSNPNAKPQPAAAVAAAILRLVNGDENGKTVRVVDGEVTYARWEWK